jgi:hypothetical protein
MTLETKKTKARKVSRPTADRTPDTALGFVSAATFVLTFLFPEKTASTSEEGFPPVE